MCGILAIITKDYSASELMPILSKLTTLQKHRGPDLKGARIWSNPKGLTVGLGHNLLKIIDSPNNTQPMIDTEDKIAIIYNGEVYNYVELKKEIDYEFKSVTDTEVILATYKKYGLEVVKKVKGMFAFVIYDAVNNIIVFARDRFGQKPLYYWHNNETFVISSEIKSIRNYPSYSTSVEHSSVLQYLLMMDTYDWKTVYKDILVLPPSSYGVLDLTTEKFHISTYQTLSFNEEDKFQTNATQVALDLTTYLSRSIRTHSQNCKSWALQISSGLDSNTLAALASDQGLASYIKAYTCLYDFHKDDSSDESLDAQKSMEALSIPLIKAKLSPTDYQRLIVNIVKILEEPKGNSCIGHYRVLQAIKDNNHRVLWSGEGADEFFGGYFWRYQMLNDEMNSNDFQKTSWKLSLAIPPPMLNKFFVSNKDLNSVKEIFYDAINPFLPGPDVTPLNGFMEFQIRHYLHYLLLQADKLSSSLSLEGRYPFLDYDLTQFALSLPQTLRYSKSHLAKPLLREAMSKFVPIHILKLQKRGFVPPEAHWFRYELRDFIESIILRPNAEFTAYISFSAVESIVQQHFQGNIDAKKLIWGLIIYELWYKIEFDSIHDNHFFV